MFDKILIILIFIYLLILWGMWLYCLIYIIKDFLRGGKNEDF